MKKIYLVLGIAASMMFSSCSDFLDREPSTELPANSAIKSTSDLQNAVNGIGYVLSGSLVGYDRMSYASEFTLFGDLRTNDFMAPSSQGQTDEIRQYVYSPNGTYPDAGYQIFYKALSNVNSALEAVPNVEGKQATIDNLKGQLIAWRGLLHFDLARMFCYIPTTVDNPSNSLGLVLADKTFPQGYKGVRTDLKTTYDYIIQQFTDALPLLSKTSDVGYFNYYAALALRARAYLYAGEYTKALADAKEVIDYSNDKNSALELLSRSNYISSWASEGAAESLFEMKLSSEYNAQRYGPGYYTDATGYPECAFNTKGYLYKYLSTHPKDIRSRLIKDQTDAKEYEAAAGYYPAKYPGQNANIYVNNPKIIRLSEVYLIAAEAQWHIDNPGSYTLTGTSAAAAKYINAIQKNRIEGYEDVTSVTLQDILHQYEIELFCENQITYAYWRNHQSVTSSNEVEIKYNDYRTILPIPQAERDYNKELQQNPEY